MKAAVYMGDKHLRVQEGRMTAPKASEVRLEIAYCGICGSDLHVLAGTEDHRMHLPSVIGHECSAVVAEVGDLVTDFKVGDHVVVQPVGACGQCAACQAGYGHVCQHLQVMGIETEGAFQSSWTVPAHTLHHLPEGVSLMEGALAEPLAICCHVVRRSEVRPGELAVVIGGGPIGLMTALAAQAEGARVLLSEVNEARLYKARLLGIHAVNPLETDLLDLVMESTDGCGADVVFEASGSQAGVNTMVALPRVRGRIVLVAIYGQLMQVDLKQLYYFERSLTTARMHEREDFAKALTLLKQRAFDTKQIITSVVPLCEIEQGFARLQDPSGQEVKVLVNCHQA